jgi:hypothetical protein
MKRTVALFDGFRPHHVLPSFHLQPSKAKAKVQILKGVPLLDVGSDLLLANTPGPIAQGEVRGQAGRQAIKVVLELPEILAIECVSVERHDLISRAKLLSSIRARSEVGNKALIPNDFEAEPVSYAIAVWGRDEDSVRVI